MVEQDKDPHKLVTGASGNKKAMGEMRLPAGTDLAAEVLRLNAELENTRKELVAERAKVAELTARLSGGAPAQEPSAPVVVPAVIEPLPRELEPLLGREAIWSLVRPAEGADQRGVLKRHREIWKRFDKELKNREPKLLRKALQCYLESLIGLRFNNEDKKIIGSNLCFIARALAVHLWFGKGVGTLGVSGPSLRIQGSSVLADGREKKVYTRLGPVLPALQLAEVSAPRPRQARKVPKVISIRKRSRQYKNI